MDALHGELRRVIPRHCCQENGPDEWIKAALPATDFCMARPLHLPNVTEQAGLAKLAGVPGAQREIAEFAGRLTKPQLYEAMIETFEGCAAAGAELLSSESVGGKEVHDEALMMRAVSAVRTLVCYDGTSSSSARWRRPATSSNPSATPG